jgi:hypothetical protein
MPPQTVTREHGAAAVPEALGLQPEPEFEAAVSLRHASAGLDDAVSVGAHALQEQPVTDGARTEANLVTNTRYYLPQTAAQAQSDSPGLLALDNELVMRVGSFLAAQDLGRLARVSHHFADATVRAPRFLCDEMWSVVEEVARLYLAKHGGEDGGWKSLYEQEGWLGSMRGVEQATEKSLKYNNFRFVPGVEDRVCAQQLERAQQAGDAAAAACAQMQAVRPLCFTDHMALKRGSTTVRASRWVAWVLGTESSCEGDKSV